MGPTPLLPASSDSQVSSVPMPSADTRPIPVTTTLRFNVNPPQNPAADISSRLSMGLNVRNSVPHSLNLLGIFVGDFNPKPFFKGHHKFHSIQRIRSQVIDERGCRSHFRFIHTQLFHDN